MRYDLQLAFKRMDTVKAEKGYAGPVVVCSVYFSPLGGYIPSRATIRYLKEQRDMEVWLAPIAGTRVLVPFRAQGPTPIGEAVMEATQFVTEAEPDHPGLRQRREGALRRRLRLDSAAESESVVAVNVWRGRKAFESPHRYSILWPWTEGLPDVAVNEAIQRLSQRFGRGSFQTRSKA